MINYEWLKKKKRAHVIATDNESLSIVMCGTIVYYYYYYYYYYFGIWIYFLKSEPIFSL